MASGKITITNNTTQTLEFNIYGAAHQSGAPVASGTLLPNKPSGAIVSGYDLYQANIFLSGSGGIFLGPTVAADAQVEFIVSSDSGAASDDNPAQPTKAERK
jgi:hypothetical protein